MDVSVIILNYNTFDYTCQCIQSVIDKTIGVSYEIILVDNASKECDSELFKVKFPFIKLIKSDVNLGFSKGCNLGISKSVGNYVLLLNSDTKLLNNAIELSYKNFNQNSKLAICTVKILLENDLQFNCESFPSLWKLLFQKFRIHKLYPKKLRGRVFLGYNFSYDEKIKVDAVHGTFMMIDKKKIQTLNEKYFMYCEDLLWCWEIRKKGFEILFEPNGLIFHYRYGSSKDLEKPVLTKKEYLDNYYDFIKSTMSKVEYYTIKFFKLL